MIRNEIDRDLPAIREVVTEAMKMLPQATGTEAAIIDRLRADNALSLSLVAEDGGEVSAIWLHRMPGSAPRPAGG
ncbi:hypothetical protein [Rhodovulum sp. YEN HP10]|uniref:hypothetical protein n=1 Tax=Rhodovulum sp. HP10 TaxID=3387397 RepID=UPI0039E1B6D4